MDTNNEILDAIEILADKKIGDNITKVLTGICTSVNINKNTCVMDSNGVSGTVYFYGSPPEVNGLYRIFVPSNDMSRSFIIVPPKFTVNPNLLDNWYFGRPVNQRGQTEYTGNMAFIIDRWRMRGTTATVTLEDDGLVINCDGGLFNSIVQSYGVPAQLLGKKVTLSVLVTENTNNTESFIEIGSGSNSAAAGTVLGGDLKFTGTGLFSLTMDLPATMPNNYLNFIICAGNPPTAGARFKAVAAKLELGSTQTLAHLENGNWVLNEIPKYEDVLSNCQRYAFNVVNSDDNYEILGGGFAMNTSQFFCFIPTPVTLRGKPTVKYSGSFRAVRNTSADAGIVINAMVVDHASNNDVSVICTGTTSFEIGEFYTLWCVLGEGTNSLIFSADL